MFSKTDRTQLPIYFLWGGFVIVSLFVLSLLGYFVVVSHQWVGSQFMELEKEIQQRQFLRVKSEAEGAAQQVDFVISQAEELLREEAKSQVKQAIAIAQVLYDRYRDSRNEAELQVLVRESLRSLRFFNGRGYIFINNLDGESVLLPPAPHLEGQGIKDKPQERSYQLIQQTLEAVANPEKSAFFKYRYPMPENWDVEYDKISYLELFEPFGWVVGAGDYVHKIEEDIKQRELARLDNLTFGENGYMAVIRSDGTVLKSKGWRDIEGIRLQSLPEDVANQVRIVLETAKQGGGQISYRWKTPNSGVVGIKHAYVKPLPQWDWVLVSGYYERDLARWVKERHDSYNSRYLFQRNKLLLSISVMGIIVLLMVFAYTRWLGGRFTRYQRAIRQQQQELTDYADALEISNRIVSSAHEGILVTDADNRIVLVNDAVLKITGYQREQLLGENPQILSSGKHDDVFYQQMWESLREQDYWQGEVWNRRQDGELYPEWLSLTAYRDEQGKVLNHIATFTDITERKRDQQRLNYLAQYDPLTDLPNRRVLVDRLSQHLHHLERFPEACVAVMFVDLDHFKDINDVLGHAAGDKVLVEIAHRLKDSVRSEDTICRLGGDEFVVLVPDGEETHAIAARVALRIIENVARPLIIEDEEFRVTTSVGIAIAPADGDNADTLMKHADTSLYHAKRIGRNNFQFFTQSMNVEITQRLEMEKQIRLALEEQQFELYYQPQFDTQSGQIKSVEALIRWPDPQGGFISPGVFIPVAEDSGQIIEIGDWVLDQAIQQAKQWQDQQIDLKVSVNVSSRQLRSLHLLSKLESLLTRYAIDPQLIVLEVTETALVENLDASVNILERLQRRGVGLSLDDFGTGYSSLTLLKRVPVSELKIDRSFIDGLPSEQGDIAITSSLVATAHNMGIEVVAEGVETPEQLAFLQKINCDKTQGYYYAPALPAAELTSRYFDSVATENG